MSTVKPASTNSAIPAPATTPVPPVAPYAPVTLDQIQAIIGQGITDAQADVTGRKSALKEIEKASGNRAILYYGRLDRAITRSDVLPFCNMLKSVGVVDNIDLIIVSPGGDGTAAETILDLCRRYCTKKLRVVVPTFAKSAATLIALGADEIVMGESSELGPIDGQVNVLQDGVQQQVSADHLLRARDAARQGLGSQDPATVMTAQIQMSLLSPAFLQFCEDAMEFARDFATKQLQSHMLKEERAKDQAKYDACIQKVVNNLTASSKHLTHGRMITARDIQHDPDLQCLKVLDLAPDDPYWIAVNDLLLRTEIVVGTQNFGKVLMADSFQLYGG